MEPLKIGDLTIPIPIIQGGMGVGISLSGLASAVADEGGVGTIATVGTGLIHWNSDKTFRQNNIDGVVLEIRKARQATNGVLAVNIMSVLTNFSDLVQAALKEKIDIIFSGAGLPLDLPKYKTKENNTKLVPIVSSGRAALIIAKKWLQNYNYLPDAFVVEGPEAGGHLGFSMNDLKDKKFNLKTLLREVLEVTKDFKIKYNKEIPVIVAGGITTGQQIREFLQLGASAVQMGTNFIATNECDANDNFKQAFINSEKKDIRLIESPVGLPGRAIENDFLLAAERGEKRPKSCKYHCIKSCNPKTTDYCIAEALLSAYDGNFDSGFAFSGVNGYKIKSITSVKEVFQRLIREYNNR
ncbi:MAG: nitronate monooxygenase [Bacteroidales bacterium]|nr:nitronate monooxygenase [Bacteroidales bacterium]